MLLKLFSILFLALFLSCNDQKENPKQLAKEKISIHEEELTMISNKTLIEEYLANYIDSINNAADESELPQFLTDNQFDYKHRGFWTTFHSPISVRAQIINRVNNCQALLVIKKSRNEKFKNKPHVVDDLIPPFIELSFYDLVLKRIEILDCYDK